MLCACCFVLPWVCYWSTHVQTFQCECKQYTQKCGCMFLWLSFPTTFFHSPTQFDFCPSPVPCSLAPPQATMTAPGMAKMNALATLHGQLTALGAPGGLTGLQTALLMVNRAGMGGASGAVPGQVLFPFLCLCLSLWFFSVIGAVH